MSAAAEQTKPGARPPLYKITYHLTNPDDSFNESAILAYADEHWRKAPYLGHLHHREAAWRFARFEQEQNKQRNADNAAWELELRCREADAQRIADKLSVDTIQFEITRRVSSTIWTPAESQKEADVYRRALAIKQEREAAAEAVADQAYQDAAE